MTVPKFTKGYLVKRPRPKRHPETRQILKDSDGNTIFEEKNEREDILIGPDQTRVSEPWPLDNKGRALPEGYKPQEVLYIEANVYFEASFTNLPLQ